MPVRIDARHHFWPMRNRQGAWPPPDLAAVHCDVEPADLAPLQAACSIAGTDLVQSLEGVADTDCLLDGDERTLFAWGVVGWVDMKAPDAVDAISPLAVRPKLRGIQPMLQDIAEIGCIDHVALDPAVEASAGMASSSRASSGRLRYDPMPRRSSNWSGPSASSGWSEWPVVRLVTDDATWLDQCLDIVPTCDHAAVFVGNAEGFYGLERAR